MILLCWVVNKKRKHDRSESNDDCYDNDILLPESNALKSEETRLSFGAKLAAPTSEDITDLFSRFGNEYVSLFALIKNF